MNRNGIALFVLMFAVLSLSIFALISYMSSRTDKQMADAGARLLVSYYEADTLAEEELDRLLAEGVEGETVSFTQPVNEERELSVKAALSPDGAEILEWRVRNIGEWVADDDLPVLQMEEETLNTGLPSWLTD